LARKPERSVDVGSLVAVDYAGAWTAERGGCHCFVYDSQGKPDSCPEPIVTSGWRVGGRLRWYVVDACAGHASQLVKRPSANCGC